MEDRSATASLELLFACVAGILAAGFILGFVFTGSGWLALIAGLYLLAQRNLLRQASSASGQS